MLKQTIFLVVKKESILCTIFISMFIYSAGLVCFYGVFAGMVNGVLGGRIIPMGQPFIQVGHAC